LLSAKLSRICGLRWAYQSVHCRQVIASNHLPVSGSLDFVHDQFALGQRFRILNIMDDVTRECLAAIPDTSISGKRVVRELAEIIERRGKPEMIVSPSHGL